MTENAVGEDVPLVPSIWPLGSGCVMTSHAIADGKALYFFRAVRDEFVGDPGVAAGFDIWDACEGAPTLTLAFADVAAIERLRDGLSELANQMQARGAS